MAVSQVAECKAIMEVVAILKPTEISAVIASRPSEKATAEAAERASEPTGSTSK